MASKILFLINGLGLGNSTRCDAIIQNLIPFGYKVDILTSENGLKYFLTRSYIENVHAFDTLHYEKTPAGGLSAVKTILNFREVFSTFKINIKILKKLLTGNSYRAIVIDSDYSLAFMGSRVSIPVIALNNVDVVINYFRLKKQCPPSVRAQLLIERFDYLFHNNLPDLVLSPSIRRAEKDSAKWIHFPPFVREGLTAHKPSYRLRRILVMLSGSQFGSDVAFLNGMNFPPDVCVDVIGREGVSTGQVNFHGKIFHDRKHLLNDADMMIINAGFSAVSEAVVLKKPVVVLAVEGHAEQYVNASLVEELGLGLKASYPNVQAKILEMIKDYDRFVVAHQRYDCPADGSRLAAYHIHTYLTGSTFKPPVIGEKFDSLRG